MATKITRSFVIKKQPLPANEEKRLLALKSYHILDSENEQEFDRITELASLICDVPIAIVTLVDEKRQWFKSIVGLEIKETSREVSFCQYTITGNSILEVEDAAKDERMLNNPLVTDNPRIRFYAGCPLIDPDGYALGTLCVLDYKPNKLNDSQKQSLSLLAQEIISHILKRKVKHENLNYENLFHNSIDLVCLANLKGYFKKVNPAFTKDLGWTEEELLTRPFISFIHPDDVMKTMEEMAKLSKGQKTINFVNRYMTKTGEYKTLDWVANPDSLTENIYAIARNITDKIKVEEQLFIAEKKFRALFEDSPDAIFLEDGNGTILDVNSAATDLQGLPKERLIGTNIRQLVPRDQYVKVLKGYKQLFFGAVKTIESSLWTGGRAVPIEISGKRVYYENKSALLLHVRDISERKKLEAERAEIASERSKRKEKLIQAALKIQEEERNRIAVEMHDDIGSGLCKISVISQVIKKGSQDPSVVSYNIQKVIDEAKEVQENISEIIWAMDPKNDTLENLLAYVHYFASEFLEASGIGFHFQLSGKIPVVSLIGKIRRSIYLIIKESLNNVVKHSEATHVELEAVVENKFIHILIRDNGKGFDSVSIARFKNGINNMRKRIAEMDGKFNITTKPGEGTIIELSIPINHSETSQTTMIQLK